MIRMRLRKVCRKDDPAGLGNLQIAFAKCNLCGNNFEDRQPYSGCHKYVPFARFANRRKYHL